jgi:mono/diheme cytochrome c family protein
MWMTNLKVLAVGIVVLGFYTTIARVIPQLQSGVPQTIDLSGNVSADELVSAGDALFNGVGGCTACHGLGTRAPNLLTDYEGQGPIGQRCGTRIPGKDCKTYIHESLINPSGFLVDGFPPIMPDIRRQLTDDQIWAVVAFLESQGGTVTVTAADIQQAASAPAETSAPAATAFSNTMDPRQLITVNACIGCHGIDGAQVPIGPSFDGIGSRRSADYIRRSILDPAADVAEGFEQFAGLMPPDFGQKLSAAQLEAIVQFLANRK